MLIAGLLTIFILPFNFFLRIAKVREFKNGSYLLRAVKLCTVLNMELLLQLTNVFFLELRKRRMSKVQCVVHGISINITVTLMQSLTSLRRKLT
jgi:hypothetical protein